MSWWRCPICAKSMRHDEAATVVTPAIVKPRSGGVDQFSIGTVRLTCPDHPGAWLKPGRYPHSREVVRA
jgi:hypothetical protein